MPETLTIPGYTIERKLGQGGMASVYLAIQESFGREVALKVMSPELSADPSFATRFMREARIVANLSHASIVPVFEVGEHGSVYYLSMEYLPAGDLKGRIQHGQGNVALAIDVCTAVCSALDVAHRKGFVHRDIKPENIMFREDGTPVVTDFGIARALDSGNALTMAGMMVGTPAYMSPEQVRGQELDGRSDLYSVGVVFYEILTGGLPFEADSSLSVALKHLSDHLPPLPLDLAEYQEFFDRLTAKNRESRFPTGADVVRSLRSLAPVREAEVNTLVRPRLTTPLATEPMMPALGAAQAFVPEKPVDKKPALQFPRPKPNEAARPGFAKNDKPHRPAPIGPHQPRPAPQVLRNSSGPAAPSLPASTTTGTEVLPRRLAPGLIGEVRTALRRDGPARNSVGWVVAGALIAASTVGVWLLLMSGSGGPAPGAEAVQVTQSSPAGTMSGPVSIPVSQQPVSQQPVSHEEEPSARRASGHGGSKSPESFPAPTPAPERVASASAAPIIPSPTPAVAQNTAQNTGQSSSSAPSLPPAPPASRPEPRPERPEHAAVAPPPSPPMTRMARVDERAIKDEREKQIAQRAQYLGAQATNLKVRSLLSAARTSMVTGALLQPAGNSARDQYIEVLQLRPKQLEALAGVNRLAGIVLDEAGRYLAFGNIYDAAYMINQARVLQPTNPRIAQLQDKLTQLQAKPLKLDQRDKTHLEHVDLYVGKAHDRLKKLPFDAHAVGDATDLYDAAMMEEPNAPGLPSLRSQLVAAYPAAVITERGMRDFHSADLLMDAARKHDWMTVELQRAAKSTLPPLPKMDGKPAPAKVEGKPAGSP